MKTHLLTLAGVTLFATPAFATSDRPLRMHANDKNNPYADVTERDRIRAFVRDAADPRARRAVGGVKFRDDALSYALAKRRGKDDQPLLRERLLAPLGTAAISPVPAAGSCRRRSPRQRHAVP